MKLTLPWELTYKIADFCWKHNVEFLVKDWFADDFNCIVECDLSLIKGSIYGKNR